MIFTFNNKNSDDDFEWIDHESKKIIVGNYLGGIKSSSLIAAFDFDLTLVTTKSDKSFPINCDDWKLLDNRLPKQLSNLYQINYQIVIISNQMGISTGKVSTEDVKRRFENVIRFLNVPCLVLISSQDDHYRKPRYGLWTFLVEKTDQPIDYNQSFYVGDAAGRKKSPLHKGDHSSGDLLFAVNVGLKFMVPEKFILWAQSQEKTVPDMSSKLLQSVKCFRPQEQSYDDHLLYDVANDRKITDLTTILPSTVHCIIFVGLPASGKSSFYRQHLHSLDYKHVSNDLLGSEKKCVSISSKAFDEGKNVVIDNTNITKANRAKWLEFCRTKKVLPLIFHFKIPLEHSLHNNLYRKFTTTSQSTVSKVVIYAANKKSEPPSPDECNNRLYEINFRPQFSDDQIRKLYYSYLNEK